MRKATHLYLSEKTLLVHITWPVYRKEESSGANNLWKLLRTVMRTLECSVITTSVPIMNKQGHQ